jgi:RimJ/RimL family protein N-acetyltransferase
MSNLSPPPFPFATPRLVLREFTPSDIPSYHALESSEANAQYQSWTPRSMQQASELVMANIISACEKPRTIWELVAESEGEMVGRVGAKLTQPDHGVQHFDLWFSFLPSVQGRGYATEATAALMAALVGQQGESGGDEVVFGIECDPRNMGSCRLAERMGFEKYGLVERAWECKGEWVGSVVWRRVVPKVHRVYEGKN